ncbi:hypothetical protein CPB97_002251 [Podila verticillata]|nr:hypothetical protein CPB97_002251 [Podila verticillata]
MRFFTSTSSSTSSSSSLPRKAWSLLYPALIATAFTSLASAALDPGFCGDCQTYALAIQPCGGTFTNADIQVPGEYVLPQPLAKCICSAVIQKVLWTCAKCASFGGSKFAAVPPNKYQTACMSWGTTVDEWNAPYTGASAPGTQTDLGGGPNPPPPPPLTSATTTTSSSTARPSGGGGPSSGSDKETSTDSNGNLPTGTSDNSTSGEKSGDSTPNGKAIGISVGIIGVAAIAGVVAVFMMKRRRRRRPLDLDSSPALANFMELDSHGSGREKYLRPASPPMAAAPVASATPAVSRHRNYAEGGSVVGGYDAQYDHYGHGHVQGYDGYGQGQYDQYGDQYNEQYYGQGYYDQHQHGYGRDYYDRPAASQGPSVPPPPGSVVGKPNEGGHYM